MSVGVDDGHARLLRSEPSVGLPARIDHPGWPGQSLRAETIHSIADCGNQVLLLIGVRGAQKAPSASHPLGYGRNAFFWSFMVAVLLFSLGGMFSIYEGVHKVLAPEPVEKVWLGLGILAFSLALATESAMRAVWRIITVQQGPGEVLVAMKVEFDPALTAREISDVINRFEAKLRARRPDAKWIFVEPDERVRRGGTALASR